MSKSDKTTVGSIARMPAHVGLILDGNRRWARGQGLPDSEGHRCGVENLKRILRAAHSRGVKCVSAFVFSTENWQRTKREVKFLMSLVLRLLDHDLEQLHADGVKVIVLGSRYGLSRPIIRAIEKAESRTMANSKGVLALCFNYGGRQEVVDAVKKILQARVNHANLDEAALGRYLYHPEVPPIDLLIRTSGEQRISNFMLWRAAYAELYFTPKHWPAFSAEDLDRALSAYGGRQRRLGR